MRRLYTFATLSSLFDASPLQDVQRRSLLVSLVEWCSVPARVLPARDDLSAKALSAGRKPHYACCRGHSAAFPRWAVAALLQPSFRNVLLAHSHSHRIPQNVDSHPGLPQRPRDVRNIIVCARSRFRPCVPLTIPRERSSPAITQPHAPASVPFEPRRQATLASGLRPFRLRCERQCRFVLGSNSSGDD